MSPHTEFGAAAARAYAQMAGQTFEDFVRQLRLPRPLTIAELVDSTVGGVKAALNRARTKLAESSPPAKSARSASPELKRIMQLYVDRFNRRDWAGVRQLTSADARLTVAERFAGKFVDAPYFANYERWPWPWKLGGG